MIRRRRAEKLIKIFFCVLLIVTLLSSTVFNCFAYGAERDTYNAIIANEVLPTSLDWDVTFELDEQSYYDENFDTNLNFKFNPVFPIPGIHSSYLSSTYENTSSEFYIANAGYNDTLSIDFYMGYRYHPDSLGFVDVHYTWAMSANEMFFNVAGVQFQTGNFYYTYDPDIPFNDMGGSPFMFEFINASSVTTMITYHELGNAVDVYSYTLTDLSAESFLAPEFFGYSADDAFTVFIDSVVVIPDYENGELFDGDAGINVGYGYAPDFCQFSRAADLNTHVTPPSDSVFADYTSWIGTAVSGFLDFQIFPGFSFGGLLMVIISFSVVIWFLKLFAGG